MINRENLKDVVLSLDNKTKNRILNTDKEYTVLILSIFNIGATVKAKLTDNYQRYQNASNNGNAILETEEVRNIILNA